MNEPRLVAETPDLEHSVVMGGSNAAQRIHCPGSLNLEKGMPDEESEHAKRGTVLHAAIELLVAADYSPDDVKGINKALKDLEGKILIPEYGEEFAITPEWVRDKVWPAFKKWLQIVAEYELVDWFIEQKCTLGEIVPGAFGTIDILAKDKQNRLHILDWKFGDGVGVSAEGSYQLGFYAACALYDTDPEIIEFCDEVSDDIYLHIVQPRDNVDEDEYHEVWPTTIEWVEHLVDQAEAAAKEAMKEDASIKPGDHCRWCRALAICPAKNEQAVIALGTDPKTLDGVTLGKALEMATQLKPWITAVWDLAEQEMNAGARVPGFKLVQKRATRQWTDEEAAEKALRAGKKRVAQIFTRKLISPTQAEKLDGELYVEKLLPFVEKRSSGLTVVPESDKRPAVTNAMELLAEALPPHPDDGKQQSQKPKANQRTAKRKQKDDE